MKTVDEWHMHIRRKWLENIGVISIESYDAGESDMAKLFYDAVYNSRRARETNETRYVRACAKAAGEYVRLSIERGNLDNVRNLYLRMERIKNGERSKIDGSARDLLGGALLWFLLEERRLPNSRHELREHAKMTISDLSSLTSRNLTAALEFYTLNETIRDKTGPRPGK